MFKNRLCAHECASGNVGVCMPIYMYISTCILIYKRIYIHVYTRVHFLPYLSILSVETAINTIHRHSSTPMERE